MKVGDVYNPYRLFNGIHIPNTILRRKGLSHGAKIVWGRLSQYAGENGVAFPRIATLGDETGMSDRQVKTYLKELREKGFIKSVRTGKSNKYYFIWDDDLEQSLRVKNGDGKDTSYQKGRKLPIGEEESCPSEESEKTPSDKAPEGINEPLRESLNENHQESGKRSHSLLQKFIVNHKQLTGTHYGFTPIVRDRDAKPIKDLLNNADFNFTDDDVLLLQRLYFERPSPNEKENKNPIAWFPLAVNRLQGALAEYKAEIKRSENQAEQRRRDEEEYYRQQELDRKEAERRAALTPEQRQLEDIHKKRKNIFMMLDARISCGRGYGDITERLKELDRAEAELLQVREAQVM